MVPAAAAAAAAAAVGAKSFTWVNGWALLPCVI
jgi:hypothetical protein